MARVGGGGEREAVEAAKLTVSHSLRGPGAVAGTRGSEAVFFHVIFVSNSVIFLDPLTTYKGFSSNYWVSFLGP